MRQYDLAIMIGRFQPFHNGHLEVLNKALKTADNVLVLVGSASKSLDVNNPFTYEERKQMILASAEETERARYSNASILESVEVAPINDFPYNDEKWALQVQKVVANAGYCGHNTRIILVGHNKDESSFYLKMFPQWKFLDVGLFKAIHATDIRKGIYEIGLITAVDKVPESVFEFLKEYSIEKGLNERIEEYNYIRDYKLSWSQSPYPPVFVTADSVVIQQGHILVIRRKIAPGKGLLALPGGFVNGNEYIKDAAIRELREETRLKVPEPVLRGSIVCSNVFDKPSRSLRGRTITTAFLIHLTNYDNGLPPVKGSDDAMEAKWMLLSNLKEEEFFEDHYHIIQDMIGRL